MPSVFWNELNFLPYTNFIWEGWSWWAKRESKISLHTEKLPLYTTYRSQALKGSHGHWPSRSRELPIKKVWEPLTYLFIPTHFLLFCLVNPPDPLLGWSCTTTSIDPLQVSHGDITSSLPTLCSCLGTLCSGAARELRWEGRCLHSPLNQSSLQSNLLNDKREARWASPGRETHGSVSIYILHLEEGCWSGPHWLISKGKQDLACADGL